MAYQKHDVNNNPITPDNFNEHDVNNQLMVGAQYQGHDVDNAETTLLIEENEYERNDIDCDPDTQPGHTVATYIANSWKNWSADYVKHGSNNEDLNPNIPIEIDSPSVLTTLAGLAAGQTREAENMDATMATFSGGNGALTVEGKFIVQDPAVGRSVLDGWEDLTSWSTATSQVYNVTMAETGKRIAFVSRAIDSNNPDVVQYSIAADTFIAHLRPTEKVKTTYSGNFKVGEVINITVGEGKDGVPNLNYLLQKRSSDTGTGGWGNNNNIAANATPGQVVQYTITAADVGKYLQFRTRIRDNNGQGGSDVYVQIWSTAQPVSPAVADTLTEQSGFGVALSGDFRVGQDITVASIPAFQGGLQPVVYEYQWQKSGNGGTNWVGFDSPWTEYDPTTILIDNPSKTLNAPEEDFLIRVQTRATDALGQQLIVAGEEYGPVEPENPVATQSTMVAAPFSVQSAYMVGNTVKVAAAAQFRGGALPYASKTVQILNTNGDILGDFADPDNRTDMLYTLTHDDAGTYVGARTVVVDADGTEVSDGIELYNPLSGAGAVLEYEPALAVETPTSATGHGRPGETVTVTAATFTGGLGIVRGVLTARIYDHPNSGPADYIRQDEISGEVVFGDDYSYTIQLSDEGKYIEFVTRAMDNNKQQPRKQEGSTGGRAKIEHHPLNIDTPGIVTGPVAVGGTLDITSAVALGGYGAIGYHVYLETYSAADGSHIENIDVADPAQPATNYQYTIPPELDGRFVKVRTDCTDEAGQLAIDVQEAGTVVKPALVLQQATQAFGLPAVHGPGANAPGALNTVKTAVYTGGYGNLNYRVVAEAAGQELLISSIAVPGNNYNFRVPEGWVNQHLFVRTTVTDELGQTASSEVHHGMISIPATPTPNGPKYAENGYSFDMYVEPNYKQGHILRVGDTLTLTVPEFFGGEAPYRYDLNSWTILDKSTGVEVFASPNNQPSGSSVTYTIPQSLQGKHIKVNYYFYDRLLTRFKFEAKLYDGNNLGPSTGIIQPAL